MGAKQSCVTFTEKVNGKTVHYWPSNFWIEPDGSNVEAEFQAAKIALDNPWVAAAIRKMSPGKAKRAGRQHRLSKEQLEDWDAIKEDVMSILLIQKVIDWPEQVNKPLTATGDGEIVEVNWWHDNEWGDCECIKCYRIGDNKLGKLWMMVRNELVAA